MNKSTQHIIIWAIILGAAYYGYRKYQANRTPGN